MVTDTVENGQGTPPRANLPSRVERSGWSKVCDDHGPRPLIEGSLRQMTAVSSEDRRLRTPASPKSCTYRVTLNNRIGHFPVLRYRCVEEALGSSTVITVSDVRCTMPIPYRGHAMARTDLLPKNRRKVANYVVNYGMVPSQDSN
jgi:hypothetical protein